MVLEKPISEYVYSLIQKIHWEKSQLMVLWSLLPLLGTFNDWCKVGLGYANEEWCFKSFLSSLYITQGSFVCRLWYGCHSCIWVDEEVICQVQKDYKTLGSFFEEMLLVLLWCNDLCWFFKERVLERLVHYILQY